MTDHLESKNLVPFSKRRNSFQLPGVRKDRDEEMLEQVDPDLTPEDEGVIRRYLHYADTLLGSSELEGLSLVPGGGPAKRLAGIPEELRQTSPSLSDLREKSPDAQAEHPGENSDSSGNDQAA